MENCYSQSGANKRFSLGKHEKNADGVDRCRRVEKSRGVVVGKLDKLE